MMPDEKYYNDLLTLFGQITVAIMAIPIILVFFRLKILNNPARVFVLYLGTTFVLSLLELLFIWSVNNYTEFWLPYLDKWHIGDTHFLRILSYLKNFLLLGWFYSLIVRPNNIRKWVFYIAITLSIMALIDYIWITGYNKPGVLLPTLNSLFVTILPMIQLWYLIQQDYKISLYKIPYLWFSIGLIFMNLFTLFFFFVGAKIYQTDFMFFVKLSLLRNVLMVLAQGLFAYGICQTKVLPYLSVRI